MKSILEILEAIPSLIKLIKTILKNYENYKLKQKVVALSKSIEDKNAKDFNDIFNSIGK